MNKKKLYFTESGSGRKTLVFLHYFGGAGNTWREVISYLQNEFHCIAIDLLGFGKSHSQEKLISVNDSTKAVLELIDYLKLECFVLIGHSMGGKIALNVASLQPKGLLSLMLIAPSPPTPEPMTDKERKEINSAFGDKQSVEKMIQNVIAHSLDKAAFDNEVNNNLQVSEIGWHSWPQLGSKENISANMQAVHVPVSIIFGAKDKKFTKHFLQKEFEKYFATFTLIEIADAAHLLPVEAPEEVAKKLRKVI